MGDIELDGTLVLEKLAAIDGLDAFYAAVDGDDVTTAMRMMRRAGVDAASIAAVVREMITGG
jgi:hypothetical protein